MCAGDAVTTFAPSSFAVIALRRSLAGNRVPQPPRIVVLPVVRRHWRSIRESVRGVPFLGLHVSVEHADDGDVAGLIDGLSRRV